MLGKGFIDIEAEASFFLLEKLGDKKHHDPERDPHKPRTASDDRLSEEHGKKIPDASLADRRKTTLEIAKVKNRPQPRSSLQTH